MRIFNKQTGITLISEKDSGPANAFKVVRILRLLRIVRVFRVFLHMRELRKMVMLISGSISAFFWAVLIMCVVMYMLSILITQLVADNASLVECDHDNKTQVSCFYGSLPYTIYTLFAAISGGYDWMDLLDPLLEPVGPALGLGYCTYILVMLMVMLNLVTGVFVDGMTRMKKTDNEQHWVKEIKKMFCQTIDGDSQTELTLIPRRECLSLDKEMKQFFSYLDIPAEEAQHIFELVDRQSEGVVPIEAFVKGCLNMVMAPKAYQVELLLKESRDYFSEARDFFKETTKWSEAFSEQLSAGRSHY